MAFDREEYLRRGRIDHGNAKAALEMNARRPSTPYRRGGVNWKYLAEQGREGIGQLEAQLLLIKEWQEYLEGKADGTATTL